MKTQIYFLVFYVFAFIGILAFSELIYKRLRLNPEYTRKISHIVATLTSLSFVYAFQSHWYVLWLAIFSFLLLFIGKLKHAFKSIEDIPRLTLGSYLLPVGIYFSFFISECHNNRIIFVLPIMILAMSDAFAGIVGISYQARRINQSIFGKSFGKSYAGTMTFLISSSLICVLTFMTLGYDLPKIVVLTIYISGATTITELISPYGSDNLTIPVVASLILAYSI